MSWTGRELQSITKNSNTYSFTYNLDGLRTKKSINGNNTYYYYDDSNNLIGLKKDNTTVLFYYDSEGKVYSMTNYSLNKYFLFFKLNEKIYDGNVQYGRDHFEDDIGVFSWRIYFARMATVEAFYNWSTNSRIYDLRAGQNSNNNFIYYHKFKYIGYYWTVIARRYYLTINGKWYW